jgi:hypothetical protein
MDLNKALTALGWLLFFVFVLAIVPVILVALTVSGLWPIAVIVWFVGWMLLG